MTGASILTNQEQPSWRKPAGTGLILLLISVWAICVVALTPQIERLPFGVQIFVYAFAGIGWIAPLRPLLRWMETGVWR
jgi:uncharacterized membrane protein YhhN